MSTDHSVVSLLRSAVGRSLLAAILVFAAAAPAWAAISASGANSPNPTNANADPIIGTSALGRLTVTASSTLTSDVAILGDDPTGIGLVLVSGFDPNTGSAAVWNVSSLTVGNEGTGRLEIVDGAIVNVDFPTNPGTGDFVIGSELDSLGTVIVSGLGTMLRLGDESFIGDEGTGILIIEDEGLVLGTNDATTGTDVFTVGLRGRVELAGGRLRTEATVVNGVILGSGRIDSENTIAVSTTGRLEAITGEWLTVNAVVDNDGEIAVHGGEIEFLEQVVSSNAAAKLTIRDGVVRFPKTGIGFDTTAGVLASTAGVNDIYGTVRIQGAGSKIVVGGGSTAVFHDPVTNNGGTIEVFPGSTPIYLQGLTTTGAGSVLTVHLADPEEIGAGQIEVAGSAALAGNLNIQLATGFTPASGDSFPILSASDGITGSLSLASVPALPAGLQWSLLIGDSAVLLSVIGNGDYNGNGVVDAADYVVWRSMLGQSGSGLPADGDGSGIVDEADYQFWRSRFGNVVGSGIGAAAAVPEPSTWLLLAAALLAAHGFQRSR